MRTRNVVKFLLNSYLPKCNSCTQSQGFKSRWIRFENTRCLSSDVETSKPSEMSRAMKLYIERAKAHEEFMKKETFAYELGKRHLANMMGEDPDFFTQKDVDRAIRYLLPSGLYDPRARPVMKPPEEIYPPSKAAQFDATGRPFSMLFYTKLPVFHENLHEIATKFKELNRLEDTLISRGEDIQPKEGEEINWTSREWLTHKQLEDICLEKLSEKHYNDMINTLERLLSHPLSYKAKECFEKYSKEKMVKSVLSAVKPLLYDENEQPYQKMDGWRKTCRAEVIVRGNGSGKIDINGKDISYFPDFQSREQILFPLVFTDMLNKVDVEATCTGGGTSGQAGAIRLGISRCLMSYVSENVVEDMRQAGLLTADRRKRERKKPGQPKARKKQTWKKR